MLVILICFTLSKRAKCKELRWCQSYCNLCKYWPFSPHVSWLSMNEINGWTKNLSAIQSFFNGFICLRLFVPWVFNFNFTSGNNTSILRYSFFSSIMNSFVSFNKNFCSSFEIRRSRFTFLHEKEGTSKDRTSFN